MSSITQRMVARFDRWLDRVVADDDRYICGACDDRFHSRMQGVEHMLHCHPEYQGVVVYEAAGQVRPATPANTRPNWAPIPAGLKPVPVHARSF
jgi:hypothetical protein